MFFHSPVLKGTSSIICSPDIKPILSWTEEQRESGREEGGPSDLPQMCPLILQLAAIIVTDPGDEVIIFAHWFIPPITRHHASFGHISTCSPPVLSPRSVLTPPSPLSLLPTLHLHKSIHPPHLLSLLLFVLGVIHQVFSLKVRDTEWVEKKRKYKTTEQDGTQQQPLQMLQMMPLILSIAAIIVIISNSGALCSASDMFNRWCRVVPPPFAAAGA